MSSKRTLKEHLANHDLYVVKSDPADERWKQRLLSQFDQKQKLVLETFHTGSWIRIVSIVIPACTLMLYILSYLKGVSPAFYIESYVRASVWWLKAVSPWGNVVFGLVGIALTLLVLRRTKSVQGFVL